MAVSLPWASFSLVMEDIDYILKSKNVCSCKGESACSEMVTTHTSQTARIHQDLVLISPHSH